MQSCSLLHELYCKLSDVLKHGHATAQNKLLYTGLAVCKLMLCRSLKHHSNQPQTLPNLNGSRGKDWVSGSRGFDTAVTKSRPTSETFAWMFRAV